MTLDAIRFTRKFTILSWHLGSRCTYACSYCPPRFHAGTDPWQPLDNVFEVIRQAQAHYVGALRRRLRIEFTGGEPTVFPRFREVLAACKTYPHVETTVISNGSRSLRYWESILPVLDTSILSFHIDHADYQEFKAKALLLHGSGKLTRIHLPMHVERFEECQRLSEDMQAAGLPVFVKPLFVDCAKDLYPYSPEQLAYIETHSTSALRTRVIRDGVETVEDVQTLILNEETDFQGWSCNVGREHPVIFMNGDLTAGECGSKVYGNVWTMHETPIRWPNEQVICPFNFCSCVLDITRSKTKPKI